MFRFNIYFIPIFLLYFPVKCSGQISHADSVFLNNVCKEGMYISYWNYPGIWYHHPEVSTLQNFYDQIDSSFLFHNDEFADCYRKIETATGLERDTVINQTINDFEIAHNYMLFGNKDPFVKLKFSLNGKSAYSYALIDSTSKPVYDQDCAFVIISGTGTNQIKTILDGIGYHDLNCYVRNLIKPLGDIFIMSMPNEDHRAIFFNKKKATSLPSYQPPFLINYLNAVNKSLGLNRLIETVAFIKYLKAKYKKVIVMGLSTGGKVALWASLLAEPDAALIASGYSILVDNDYNAQMINSMSYGNYLLVYDKDSTKARLSQLHTQFLLTQAQNDGPLTQYDIDSSVTKNFLMAAGNMSFYSNYVNHSFPPCPVIDSFLQRCLSMAKVIFSTDESVCNKDSMQVKLHFDGTPPFTFQLYKDGQAFTSHVANDTLYDLTLFDEGNYLVKNLVDGAAQNGYISDTLKYRKDLQPSALLSRKEFVCDSNKTKVAIDLVGDAPFVLRYTRNNIADSLWLAHKQDSVLLPGGNYIFQTVEDAQHCQNLLPGSLNLHNNDLQTHISNIQYNCLNDQNIVSLQSNGLLPLTLSFYDSTLQSYRYELINNFNSTLSLDSGAYRLISLRDSNNCFKAIDSSFLISSEPVAFAADSLQYHCGDAFAVMPIHLKGKANWTIQTRYNGILNNKLIVQAQDTLHLRSGSTTIVRITDGHNCELKISDSIRQHAYQALSASATMDSFDCEQNKVTVHLTCSGNYPLRLFGRNGVEAIDEWIFMPVHDLDAKIGAFSLDSILDRTQCKLQNIFSANITNDTINTDGILLDKFTLKTTNTGFAKYYWYLNDKLYRETEDPFLDVLIHGNYAVGYFNEHQCFF